MNAHRHQQNLCKAPSAHRGFTLLEVLIALVVLGVGILGIAGLQTVGLRYTHSSHLATVASFLGNDMADRIRANDGGARAGSYNAITGNESNPSCGSSCSDAQQATLDGHQWGQAVSAQLPSGSGSVTGNADGTFTITLGWTEMDADGPGAKSYAIRVLP
jgi:type IV pilus assembly protein PilV